MNNGFIKLLSAVVLVAIMGGNLQAQERPLGTWKAYMPYGNSRGVFDAGSKVYSIAMQSAFSYDKATGAIQLYDKVNGLNDIGIKTANYDPVTDVLLIAYENSNLDLIYHGTDIYNISDIKNKNTISAVSIHGISFFAGKAFISSDIGISTIDLARKEISNTYIIGSNGSEVKVYSTTTNGTTIYAATAEGVKYASYTQANLQNFNSWQLFDTSQGIPRSKGKFIVAVNNAVYAVVSNTDTDTLYRLTGNQWQVVYTAEPNNFFTSLNGVNNKVYFTTHNNSFTQGKAGKIDTDGTLTVNPFVTTGRPYGWYEDNQTIWGADEGNGLIKSSNGNTEAIVPDGPPSSSVFDINSKNGVLYVAAGGVSDIWEYRWNGQGFYIYKDGSWAVTNRYNYAPMQDYFDIICTDITKEKTYFGSFTSGLIERNNNTGEIKLYDKNNSLLEGALGDDARTKISALTVDQYDNVWIGNAGASKPIKLIKPDGTWKEFSAQYSFDLMKKMIVDQYGQIWAPLRGAASTGILVWSYNNTIDDPSDDKARLLRPGAGAGGLPNEVVNCIAEDLDGNIWAGTNEGIGVFYCPGSVLTTYGCDADQIKVERDGYIGYLFGTQSIRAIAVDAANRKWVGTTNGLWLISADGKDELLKFTSLNSPLPADQIIDITIDDRTGEVFIATIGGLVSYQGDAMTECKDCDGAIVYPNPVKPDYDGPIAIKGLVENAYVKITDISGTLVYQGKANGAQMVWDGKGYNGKRVKNGVYLVFSSTDLGKSRKVAKILVSN